MHAGRVCDVCRPAFRRADMWSGESDASHLRTQSRSFLSFACASGSWRRAYVWYCRCTVSTPSRSQPENLATPE